MVTVKMEHGNFFATAAKGLEDVVAGELRQLGIAVATVEKGGVRFSGDMASCYRANLWLRTAQRILIPLAEFPCSTPQQLYDGVRTLAWQSMLTPDMTFAVSCNLRDSAMTHSGFVALKTKDAIADSLRDACGRRPNVDPRDPDLQVNVHVFRNHCTISLDSSGVGLDKRGYRLDTGEAPLRETLAAALVYLSGWDGTVPLVDPMCGAGTIPIEAALLAVRRPPGLLREKFAFQRWPGFAEGTWRQLLQEAREQLVPRLSFPIVGRDISAKAIDNAKKNSRRAGIEALVTFEKGDMLDLVPPAQPGILIFNPPYGVRLGELEALQLLYKKIGDCLKQRCTGSTAYLFTGNPELSKWVGLRAARRIVLFNGPIECRLLKYELY